MHRPVLRRGASAILSLMWINGDGSERAVDEIMTLRTNENATIPPAFRIGDHVGVEIGLAEPQIGEVVAASNDAKSITVRFYDGLVGDGDLPLFWKDDEHYELLGGGTVKIGKLS